MRFRGGLNRFPMLEVSLWRAAKIIQFYLSSGLLFVNRSLKLHNKSLFNNYLLITMNPLLHNLNPNSQASPDGCQLENMGSCGPKGNPYRKTAIGSDKWLNYLYTNKTWQNQSKDFKRNVESSYYAIKNLLSSQSSGYTWRKTNYL